MKGLLISCLIFTLSLASTQPITASPTSTRRPPANPDMSDIQSWCAGTPNPSTCVATIRSDPRKNLKRTPTGAAVILVDAAKANVVYTTTFINAKLRSVQEDDVTGRLHDCLMGYNTVRSGLDFDPGSLDTPEGRRNIIDALNSMHSEVTYDCGWRRLQHFPPLVQQLDDRVQSFAESVSAASIILTAIQYEDYA